MTATIIRLPQTQDGRDLLRETLADLRSAETRLFVTTEFDWDASAVEIRRYGPAPVPQPRREVW